MAAAPWGLRERGDAWYGSIGARPQPDAADVAVERIEGRLDAGLLFICDHASNALPEAYGTLGLPPAELRAPHRL